MDGTGTGWLDAGDAFHEGGLAGAVVTGEGNAFPGLHGKRKIIEKHAGTKLDAQGLDGNHRGRRLHTPAPRSTPEMKSTP